MLRRLSLIPALALVLALTGCPQEPVAPAQDSAAAAPASGSAAPAAAPVAPAAATPGATKEKAPPSPAGSGAIGVVDRACKVDSDCEIKDVGSCCGYRPACVNKDSPTFPEQVQAKCAEEGRASTCGFPQISACECNDGKCAAASNLIEPGRQD